MQFLIGFRANSKQSHRRSLLLKNILAMFTSSTHSVISAYLMMESMELTLLLCWLRRDSYA